MRSASSVQPNHRTAAAPLPGRVRQPLPARSWSGARTQLCYEPVCASSVLHLQRERGERWGFAATVWNSLRLSLKGLKTARQMERASLPRAVGKYVPTLDTGKLRQGEAKSLGRTASQGEAAPGQQSCLLALLLIRSSSSSSASSR